MPAVNDHPDDYLRNLLKTLGDRITALETQQNFGVRDKAGVQRVQAGLLKNGDYGFSVTDANGQSTEYLPTSQAVVPASEFTTSAGDPTWVDLPTPGPSVVAVVGASGAVLASVAAWVGVTGATGGLYSVGRVGIGVDGANPVGEMANCIYMSSSLPGGTSPRISASQSYTGVLTGLTPGAHTFKLRYSAGAVGSGSATFQSRGLQVRPL